MGQRIEEKVSVVNEFTFDFDESLDEITIPSFMNCLSLSMRLIFSVRESWGGLRFPDVSPRGNLTSF